MFTNSTFKFLGELSKNNQREWFNNNKLRYEEHVRTPALLFIEEMKPHLESISPHFRAISKKTGGSLMRIYRDTRFSKDKTPYKTNIGIQFRHEAGKDIHAPGFYVHIEPGSVFLAAGIWHPDSRVLGKIRNMIDDNPNAWKSALNNIQFCNEFELTGESLKRPPRGFSSDHPLITDLKRKDFIAMHTLGTNDIFEYSFPEKTIQHFSAAVSFMRYLCTALDLPF
jgi:uncharacterized protein (TIGR02453 family)